MRVRPSFSDLTPEEQLSFGNGVGPNWFPPKMREFITVTASWFFQSACWRHHDFGYAVGGDRFDRARCDWKFFKQMLIDAASEFFEAIGKLSWRALLTPLAVLISTVFYIAVRAGGQKSFRFGDQYAALDEVRALIKTQEKKGGL